MNHNGIQLTSEQNLAMAHPLYVERGGDLVARQPFMQENTHMRCFFLEADRDRLQALCDRVFNLPSEGALHFRPLASTVLLSFAQITRIYSVDEYGQQLGSMDEIDVAFWIPMLYRWEEVLRLSWYVAYIFVDNPFAMATGREVYGYPKTLARFQIPQEMASRESYWVESAALERFHPDARVKPQRIFEVVRSDSSDGEPDRAQPLDAVRHLLPMLIGEGESFQTRLALGRSYLRNFLSNWETPVLFLRQLRDIQNSARAAYQEIIEAPARVTRFHRGGLLPGSFQVRFTPNATFPIAEELGLRPDGHPVRGALWAEFDFLMDAGQTLWRAGYSGSAR